MPQIMQQSRHEEDLGIVDLDDLGELLVMPQLAEILECRSVDSERVFESRVVSGRVDEPHESELTDTCQSLEFPTVDELANALCHGDIDAGRKADDVAQRIERGDFGDG